MILNYFFAAKAPGGTLMTKLLIVLLAVAALYAEPSIILFLGIPAVLGTVLCIGIAVVRSLLHSGDPCNDLEPERLNRREITRVQ